MFRNPYEKFSSQKLTLNDYLAIDRTELANERSLLAYGRTAIALLITGVSAIKFFEYWWIWGAGAVFIAGAAAVMLTGWRRYRWMSRRLAAALEQQTGESTPPLDKAAGEKKEEEKREKEEKEKEKEKEE